MSDGLKLLGAIIDTGSVHTLREIGRDLFIDNELTLYDFMRSHYRRYSRVPAIDTVEEELGITVPAASETPEYYIERVHNRQLYNVVRDKYQQLKDTLRDYDMEGARAVINDLSVSTRIARSSNDIRTIGEAMQDVLAEYEYSHDNPGLSGVPTGWPLFDLNTGGYQPGDLITWVARMAMGKTYIMLQQARMAWQFGYSVLVVTMEMTIEQITRRLVAMNSGINPDYIRKGTLSVWARRRMQVCVDNLAGSERFRLFSGGLRKRTTDIELLVQEYRPDIVFIDGVYMMQPESKKAMQKIERVSEVFDDLKRMTIAHNIPVVVTTQFNRMAGKKGKDGSLENIAFTDAISTHSSLVVSLSEGEGDALAKKNQRVATFLKGREGESGRHILNYSFSPINFSEIIRDAAPGDDEDDDTPARPAATGTNLDWMA